MTHTDAPRTADPRRAGRRASTLRTTAIATLAVAVAAGLSGCGFFCRIPRDPMAVPHGDRCGVEDRLFLKADQAYSSLGSIALVERYLRETEQLRNCEVNELLYRLRKVHGLP